MADASSKRPDDTAFKQQRLAAWKPILTPRSVIATFVCIGLPFIFIGIVLKIQSDEVVEHMVQYDGSGTSSSNSDCKITEANAGTSCTIDIEITEDMAAPVYLYYGLDNFYQNHRRYVKSRVDDQLLGDHLSVSDLTDCAPLKKYNGTVLSPCGLIANSLFTDVITVSSEDQTVTMSELDIAWDTDVRDKFAQPENFEYEAGVPYHDVKDCDSMTTCNTSVCESYLGKSTCKGYACAGGDFDDDKCSDGEYAVFYYPDESSYTYLYESFPDIVSPLVGVKNEHFIVWMRTAGLPNFRKLYGRITTDLKKGTTLKVAVTANFNVDEFGGAKYIVLSTTSWFGGKNDFLGIAYIVVGSCALGLAVFFGIKHTVAPRKLGDTSFLSWD